ncbi:TRADD-N-associated membrane domain-containing protein [Paractinoplanes globisporus]|uniref:Cyanobacterial TRADD-N associated 2 transmembrane domain-containing protein n=1 Tax=Paractinoplanes globisporus TaxID=113565 RepID=A0ABW6WAY3_9ACTN|nr:hypothetical protein [Actinoplanes globisporus]
MAEEQNRTKTTTMIAYGSAIALVSGLGAGVLIWLASYVDAHPPRTLPGTVLFLLAGGLVILAVAMPFAAIGMRRFHEHRQEQSEKEFKSIENASGKVIDEALGGLISFNFRLMDRFINVALMQAKAAYLLCAVSAGAALLVLLTGTAMLLTAGTAQVWVGGLTAAGTALFGFISVTFMRMFRATSRQMSYYYGQPLVHCYLLHAEWLGERASELGREPTRLDKELIHATMRAGHDAQNHLLQLVDPKHQFHDAEPRKPFLGTEAVSGT